MDGQQIQVSDEEREVLREESRRRRRKKAITSPTSASMDQISIEFVLPTVARGGNSPDTVQLDVAGNWTVEQVAYFTYMYLLKRNDFIEALLVQCNELWCVCLVSQVKAQVWLKAVTSNLCPEFYQRFSPDHCILLYQKKGNLCEIYDKHQVFQTLDCIRYWRGTTNCQRH